MTDGQFFKGVLMAGEGAAVDEDVEAGVFTLYDDVHRCWHVRSLPFLWPA